MIEEKKVVCFDRHDSNIHDNVFASQYVVEKVVEQNKQCIGVENKREKKWVVVVVSSYNIWRRH